MKELPFVEELPAEAGRGSVEIQVTVRCGPCRTAERFGGDGTSFEGRIGKTLRDAGWHWHGNKYGWVCKACKVFLDSLPR